jgi:transglutaminase-like putative cysteine protease
LVDFDGRTWRASPTSNFVSSRPQLPKAPPAQIITYTVTLEPHNRAWLFALEWPVALPRPVEAGLTFDYQLWAKNPVQGRIRYDVQSTLRASAIGRNEHRALINAALKLPTEFNPRTRALATQWRKEVGNNDTALIQRMLNYFHKEKFYYTLRPPLLGEDSVDDFLFTSRRGFCEHYASAFVFMMRAAGIPARVVTGYQGGELNPNDGTLIVRQSDAHAWAEIWLHDQGWQRIDPTAAVAPARIERGLADALPPDESVPLLTRSQLAWLHPMRLRWEAITNTWNQWVIGYNPQRQRSFLANLGLPSADWQHITALFSSLCGALLFGYTLWAVRGRRTSDPALKAWQNLSKKLARHGLARHSWEGPSDYAKRAISTLTNAPDPAMHDLAKEVGEIATLYVSLRYERTDPATKQHQTTLRELKKRITQLQVRR